MERARVLLLDAAHAPGRDPSSCRAACPPTPFLRSARTTKNAEFEVAPSGIGRVRMKPPGVAPYWMRMASGQVNGLTSTLTTDHWNRSPYFNSSVKAMYGVQGSVT
ncbi:hypothetical protein [Streptomyces sp. NPDC059161]|uniref:hypothetical protein n=1 Tax=unclassified Streptomyces TaxID=2593676 RepID=UPI00365AA167